MLQEGKNGVVLSCNQCGAQMILAANLLQASVRRRPSGWLELSTQEHTCPICSSAVLNRMRAQR